MTLTNEPVGNEAIAKKILYEIGCDLGVVGVIDWRDTLSQQKIVFGIQKALDAKDQTAQGLEDELQEIKEQLNGPSLHPEVTGVAVIDDIKDLQLVNKRVQEENQKIREELIDLTSTNKILAQQGDRDFHEAARLRDEVAQLKKANVQEHDQLCNVLVQRLDKENASLRSVLGKAKEAIETIYNRLQGYGSNAGTAKIADDCLKAITSILGEEK